MHSEVYEKLLRLDFEIKFDQIIDTSTVVQLCLLNCSLLTTLSTFQSRACRAR